MNIKPVIPMTVGDWNLINRVIIPPVVSPAGHRERPDPESALPETAPPVWATSIIPCSFPRPNQQGSSGAWGRPSCCPRPPRNSSDPKSGAPGPPASSWSNPSGEPMAGWSVNCGPLPATMTAPASTRRLSNRFINYNLDEGWYLISDMIITANWNAVSSQRWTVPLGGGVGKLFKIGNQPINVKDRGLLQCRKAGCRPGLAVGVYGSIFVPQINSRSEFMKRDFVAQLDRGIRANDCWYQNIEKVNCCERIMLR